MPHRGYTGGEGTKLITELSPAPSGKSGTPVVSTRPVHGGPSLTESVERRPASPVRSRAVGRRRPSPAVPSETDARRARSYRLLVQVGLTLVELSIVIAIVAILTAIAVPSYSSYRERVRVHQATTDIAAMSAAIKLYETDNRTYPATLAEIGKAGMLDPWNRPYEYLRLQPLDDTQRGKVRKDKNLVPINSDFDLYSKGKDGDSQGPLTAKASYDDIVRANDGRFVGLASDY